MGNERQESSQLWLIARLLRIFKDQTIIGLCFGVSGMRMQAILAGDVATFDARLQLIHEMDEETFEQEIQVLNEKRLHIIHQVQKEIGPGRELTAQEQASLLNDRTIERRINQLQEIIESLVAENKLTKIEQEPEFKRRKNSLLFNAFVQREIENRMIQLSEQERLKLDIPVFMNGVLVYQKHLFSIDELQQNIEESYPLIASALLEQQGGVSKISTFFGAYNLSELTELFDSLHKVAKEKESGVTAQALALVLTNINHAITIGYHPDKDEWSSSTDANRLPACYFKNSNELAEHIIHAFSSNEIAIIFTEIYLTLSSEAVWKPVLTKWQNQKQWKEMHEFTSKKNELTDFSISSFHLRSRNNNDLYIATHSLLTMAASKGDLKAVDSLLVYESDPDQKLKVTLPALDLSIIYKHLDVFNALLNAGADPNYYVQCHNFTPLVVAVATNGLDMAKILLDKGADVNLCMDAGETALFYASQNNEYKFVQLLLDYDADWALSYYSTAEFLRQFAKDNKVETQMEQFIQEKQKQQPPSMSMDIMIYFINHNIPEPYIAITPKEIAILMGNKETLAVFEKKELELAKVKQLKLDVKDKLHRFFAEKNTETQEDQTLNKDFDP